MLTIGKLFYVLSCIILTQLFYFSLSFLVDACMMLLAHVDTEGLFRKSGSVVRLKALRVSDGWSCPCFHYATLKCWELTKLCFVCPGKTGCRGRVPALCSSLWCGWFGEAVLQGAARACTTHRIAGSFPQGPAAAHWGGEDLCHNAAILCTARQKPMCFTSLFWLPP